MKPTFRLIRHRLRNAYGWLFSFLGVTGLVSGALVLSAILAMCWRVSDSPWRWAAYAVGAIAALGYCVPWGVFFEPVLPEESVYL